jgi:hypothetical protein
MHAQVACETYPHGDHELPLFIDTYSRIARHNDVAEVATDSLPHSHPTLPWHECITHTLSPRILLAATDDLRHQAKRKRAHRQSITSI